MDFVPTELTPQQKQLQEQAEKYKKMRLSKVGLRVRGHDLYLCFIYTATKELVERTPMGEGFGWLVVHSCVRMCVGAYLQ